MHTHEQTTRHPHCGRCSQCISRRYATLASKFASDDPDDLYKVALLTGERLKETDLTLVESFIRTATDIGTMSEAQLVEHYGEVSRVLRHVQPLSSDEVAEKVVRLYRRHASEVSRVMDDAIRVHASDIREGKLSPTCAIILAVPESYRLGAQHGPATSLRCPTDEIRSHDAEVAKQARATTVAKLIKELNYLKPQMLEDESEYNRLRVQYPDFLTFRIAEQRPDLKLKVLAIRASTRHVRLAQELASAHHGRELSTIQDDWKDFKPEEFRRSG